MKLYDFKSAPNPLRLNLFIAEKGIEVPTQQIDMMKGEHRTEQYRAINPMMTLPAMALDDGTLLTEVVGIYSYLESLHPQLPLMGETAQEKAEVLAWEHRCYIEGMGGAADMFRNANKAFENRALPGPTNHAQIPALIERGQKRVAAFFNILEERLSNRDYMVGANFTAADITAFVFVHFCTWVKISVPESCPNVKAWFEKVGQRPAIADFMKGLAG